MIPLDFFSCLCEMFSFSTVLYTILNIYYSTPGGKEQDQGGGAVFFNPPPKKNTDPDSLRLRILVISIYTFRLTYLIFFFNSEKIILVNFSIEDLESVRRRILRGPILLNGIIVVTYLILILLT